MPVTPEELVRVLAMLAEEENLKVTVKETLKGGAMAGAGAVVGGFFGGPIGIAVGGVAGSMAARWYGRGKFREVSVIITELEREQREGLHRHYQSILLEYEQDDSTSLNNRLSNDGELREKMLHSLKLYIKDTLKEIVIENHVERGKAD